MAAIKRDIIIEKGATFRLPLRLLDSLRAPLQLQGYVARMHVRGTIDDAIPALDWTSVNGAIVIVPTLGLVLVKGPAAQTALLDIDAGVYDLELESPGGEVDRLYEGKVKVKPNVTRPVGELP